MQEPVILASDIGTSSVKSVLFDLGGNTLDTASRPYATRHSQSGWSDQDPADWWNGYQQTVRELVTRQPQLSGRIAVIGVSGQMLGCLPVDRLGSPLHPALTHADTRAAEQACQIGDRIGGDHLYALTGNILDARSSLAKLLWFRQHRPSCYKDAARFLQAKDFIVSQLTGNIDTTDLSDAAHAQWIDLVKQRYLADVFTELGLAADKLPALHRGTDQVGKLTAAAAGVLGLKAGIPVVAGAGDGSCAGAGAGSARTGDFYACLGTTAWVSCTSDQPIFDRCQRLFNMATTDGSAYGVFGTAQNAGQSVLWAMDLFGDASEKLFDRDAAQAPPGSDGLIFLPYLDGERSPIYDADARGIYFGIGSRHRSAHFRRAVLEGVALALRSIVAVFREQTAVDTIKLIGGGARSTLWRQIIAAACGVVLEQMATPAGDATALGMALTAGVGVGLYPDLTTAQSVIQTRSRENPDPAMAARYEQIYPLFEQLYLANKPLFSQLAAIQVLLLE
jgi:xylulokinase